MSDHLMICPACRTDGSASVMVRGTTCPHCGYPIVDIGASEDDE